MEEKYLCLSRRVENLLSKLDLNKASEEARGAAEELKRLATVIEAEQTVENHPHNINSIEKLRGKIEYWKQFEDVCEEFVPVYGSIRNVEFYEEKLIFYAESYSVKLGKQVQDSYVYRGQIEIKEFISEYKKTYDKMVKSGEI